jgi:hypothetical protein
MGTSIAPKLVGDTNWSKVFTLTGNWAAATPMSVQMPPIDQQVVNPSGLTSPPAPALHDEWASVLGPAPYTGKCATPSGRGNEGGPPVLAPDYGAISPGTTT